MMFHGVGDAADDLDTGAAYPTLAPGQSYNSSNNTIFDSTSGDTVNANTGAIVSGPTLNFGGSSPSGNPSSGFNWGGLFSTALNDATKVAQTFFTGQNQQAMTQAQLQAQQNQLRYGTTVSASVGSSNLMPILLLGGGALVLVMVLKGRK